jgi:multidrug resistance efflux pump
MSAEPRVVNAPSAATDLLAPRSEAVLDIMEKSPPWVMRWGITALAIVLLSLLVVAWLIKYPDTITAPTRITTATPPVRIVARSSGRLIALNVREGSAVRANHVLATIENPALPASVFSLKGALATSGSTSFCANRLPAVQDIATLGELQPHYNGVLQACQDLRLFQELQYYKRKRAAIQRQVGSQLAVARQLRDRSDVLTKDLALAQGRQNADDALLSSGIVSREHYDDSQRDVLQKKAALHQQKADVESAGVSLNLLEQEQLDLWRTGAEEERRLTLATRGAIATLDAQIAQWEQRYVLTSPINGTVSLFSFRTESQFVSAGDVVMTVVPPGDQKLHVELQIPREGSGKVRLRQAVFIRLLAYPYQEYGMLRGVVAGIAPAPQNGVYLITVELSDGLTTTYGRKLEFIQDMEGHADIVTEDLRLLQRLFNIFKHLYRQSRAS